MTTAKEDTETECRECGVTMMVLFGEDLSNICQECEVDGLHAQLTKATADAEAHRMRCDSLEAQLATSKRSELESDRRAKEAEASTVNCVANWIEAMNEDDFWSLVIDLRNGDWRKP